MGSPMRDHRLLVEGGIYRYRTGVAWRDLQAEFGPWQTVWKRHHRFSLDGTWDRGVDRRCSLRPMSAGRSTGGSAWTPPSPGFTSKVRLLRGQWCD
jgi:transposase